MSPASITTVGDYILAWCEGVNERGGDRVMEWGRDGGTVEWCASAHRPPEFSGTRKCTWESWNCWVLRLCAMFPAILRDQEKHLGIVVRLNG